MKNKQLARTIKKLCEEKGIQLNCLISECGLSKSFIYDLEKRNSSPSADKIYRIANFLGCSANLLLGLPESDKEFFKSEHLISLLEPIMEKEMPCNKFGITIEDFNNWKSGRTKPSKNLLIALAEYFNVTYEYITGWTDFSKEENKRMCANASIYLEDPYSPFTTRNNVDYYLPYDVFCEIKNGVYLFTKDTLSQIAIICGVKEETLLTGDIQKDLKLVANKPVSAPAIIDDELRHT